ncbi:hypothetical protein Tco_0943442 [Tanacetum coccineum]
MDHESKEKGYYILKKFEYVDLKGISKFMDHAVVDSGCCSHMTGNKAYLSDYEDYNGGFVTFGSDPKGEDAADKEEQHLMQDNEKDFQDELEMLVTQELAAKAMDDVSRQAFVEEKRRITSQKKAAQ